MHASNKKNHKIWHLPKSCLLYTGHEHARPHDYPRSTGWDILHKMGYLELHFMSRPAVVKARRVFEIENRPKYLGLGAEPEEEMTRESIYHPKRFQRGDSTRASPIYEFFGLTSEQFNNRICGANLPGPSRKMSQHRGSSNDKRNSQSRISNSQTGAPSGASAMLHSNRVSRDQDRPPRPDKKRYHTVPPPTWGEMRGAEKACVRCKGQHPVQECTRKRRKKKKR
jgi:hypothetical protein